MRALLRDAEDQTLIALEVEEAIYDPEDQLLMLYAASGTNYEVSRIVRSNADSMIKELAEKTELTLLKRCEAEEWFISISQKVEYLFPESHSIAYAILMIRLVWYVLHYPDVTDSLMIETAVQLLQE